MRQPIAILCAGLFLWLVGYTAPAVAADPSPAAAAYPQGELVQLEVDGRHAYLVKPTGKVDPQKRWIIVAPFWLAFNDKGQIEHRMYVDRFLAAGFHVAGVDVSTSCGSPRGAEVYHQLYERLTSEFGLNPKGRLLGQSNGGLISYAWAFRHPQCVDRIGCIYPATDFRSWPGIEKVLVLPEPAMSYSLTLDELTRRTAELNPIDNLAPLAKAGVKIFHIHGDMDGLVPADVNSHELVARYAKLGGDARVEVLPGLGHGGKEFYASESLAKFLTE
ncbi:MAG: alpha/beta hydrolase family protein [Pirellulales bacterium]